jgi:hypothetical protein
LLDPPLLPPPGIALETALPMSDAVSFTVSTTRLITLFALESAPPFLEPPPRFFEVFFAGAFLAGAFLEAFFAGAFFEAFFEEAFFDDALRLAGRFFDAAFLLDFFAAFFEDFFAGFLLADFFDDFLLADFLEDFFADFFEDFLAAMDSLLFKTVSVGSRTFERKFVLRGNYVARISM